MIEVIDANHDAQIEQVRSLLHAYAAEHAALLGESLAYQDFEGELEGLPGRYAPPGGCLLLAADANRAVGCVGLRPLENGLCEMKRLYVARDERGRKIGRLLVETVLDRAARGGYARIRLDSLHAMTGAVALYRSYGFREIAPYWDNPARDTIYMEKDLSTHRPDPRPDP